MAGTVARRLTRSNGRSSRPRIGWPVHPSGWPPALSAGAPARRVGQGRHREDDGRRGAGARAGHRRPADAGDRGGGPAGHRAGVRHPAPALRGAEDRRGARRRGGARAGRRSPRRRCWSTWRCSTGSASPGGRCAGWGPSSSPPRWPRACATSCSPARPRSASPARTVPGGRSTTPSSSTPRRPAAVVSFLDVTRAMADLARVGPIHSQSEGVVAVLHSPLTAVHLVTLLEDLPVTETLETLAELAGRGSAAGRGDRQPGAAAVAAGPLGRRGRGRSGGRGADPRRAGLGGRRAAPEMIDGLVAETVEHAVRVEVEAAAMARLRGMGRAGWSCRTWSTAWTSAPSTSWRRRCVPRVWGCRMSPRSLDVDALLDDPRDPDPRLLRLGRRRQDDHQRRARHARRGPRADASRC